MVVKQSGIVTPSFIMILISSAILGAAMPMLIVLGGLAGLRLAPSPNIATVPPSIQMLAGLFLAAPLSIFMSKYGRRNGFLLGALLAFMGGISGALAMWSSCFWALCLAHIILGGALVSFGYFRFAAGEAVGEEWQSVAISLVLGSGLIAALLGPEIFIRTKDLIPDIPFAGAYLSICALALIGMLPVSMIKLPTIARDDTTSSEQSKIEILLRRPVLIAVAGAAVSGGVMMLVMTPTPLAMIGHDFHADQASDVIRWHVVAMFAPSFVTGFLIKRFGVIRIIGLGLICLALAAGIAMADITLMHFYGSLVLLGIGWNFGFIGSTSLLNSTLKPQERGAIQGVNETLVAGISAFASFSSGAIIAGLGWFNLAAVSLVFVAIALLSLLIFHKGPTSATAIR